MAKFTPTKDGLTENFVRAGRYQDVIDTADVILEYYPNFVVAMLDRGTAAAYLMDTEFRRKYPTLNDIPPLELPTYFALDLQNHADFARAEALGWRETDGVTPASSSGQ